MRQIKLVIGFLTVGSWTLASRVLGFMRDVMIAAALGTGPVAEAFIVAFSLPNLFRRFFAEGAFNMAFVPMFSKELDDPARAKAFAEEAMSALTTVLIVLTVVAMVTMPWLVLAMASGFADDDRLSIAIQYGRICFPYIVFISIAALLSGVLNSVGRFHAAAAAPIMLNVVFIAAIIIAGFVGWPIGDTLAWSVPIAGVAQMVIVWVAAKRAGFALMPRMPRLTPQMKRLAIIAAPAALAGGVVQINLLVGRQVASFYEGAVGWLSYADRLYQLPLGVVGIAVGIVLLPDLSRRLKHDDTQGARDAFNRATEFSLALTIPAAVALCVIPLPLVSVLYERGAFGADDTANTALAVAIYGLGLPAFVLHKTLQPLFFAREDTRRPFYVALVSLVVNAAIALSLRPVIGFSSAAIGTTLSGWATVGLLMWMARGLGPASQFDARFYQRTWRIFLASIAMGVALWFAWVLLGPLLATAFVRYIALIALIAVGLVSYFVFGRLFGAFSLSELKASFRRS